MSLPASVADFYTSTPIAPRAPTPPAIHAVPTPDVVGAVGRTESRPAPMLLADLYAQPELLEPPAAIIPNLVYENRVTLLAASPKAGKSTLMGQGASALTAGAEFLGSQLEPSRVLWYGLDEGLPDAVQRFKHFGADPALLYVQHYVPTPDDFKHDLEATDPRLVVVDVLASLWPSGTNEGDAVEVAAVMRPLIQVSREYGVAVVFLHHTRKAGDQARGSVEILAAPDLVLTLRPHSADASPDDNRRILEGRGRAGIIVHAHLSYDGERYQAGDAPLSMRSRVLQALLTGATSANGVCEFIGGRRENVLTELRRAVSDRLVKQGDRSRYELTDSGRLAAAGLLAPEPPGTTREPLRREEREKPGTTGNHSGTGVGTTLPGVGNHSGTTDSLGVVPDSHSRENFGNHLEPAAAGDAGELIL